MSPRNTHASLVGVGGSDEVTPFALVVLGFAGLAAAIAFLVAFSRSTTATDRATSSCRRME